MSKPQVAPEAVSMREAAIIMGVSERSVRTLCKLGLLLSFKIGRTVRIRYEAIRQFMESGGVDRLTVDRPQGNDLRIHG